MSGHVVRCIACVSGVRSCRDYSGVDVCLGFRQVRVAFVEFSCLRWLLRILHPISASTLQSVLLGRVYLLGSQWVSRCARASAGVWAILLLCFGVTI